jgi:hypothetical protein
MRKNDPQNIGFISLREASEITGYHPDYLSYLIRKGKLEGRKIGREWVTTKKAVNEYLSKRKFFPLKDILLSKLSLKKAIIISFVLLLSLTAIFLFLPQSSSVHKAPGDFSKQKLQSETFNVQSSNNYKLQEITITTYPSDSAGGIEVSISPESAILKTEKKNWWEKIKNFFKREF